MTTIFKEETNQKNVHAEFKTCHYIFKQKAYDKSGTPTVFKIHQALKKRKTDAHNCFGCSLSDSILLITNYLSKYNHFRDIKEDFSSYILLQNLLVDRLETILDMVNMPQDVREKEFYIFKQISAWAYFLKPHTTFITSKQALCVFENNILPLDFEMFSLIVNNDFILKYHKTRVNKSNYITELTKMGYNLEQINEKPMLLILPNMSELTIQFCDAVNRFIEIFLKDEFYLNLYIKTL